MSPTVPTTIPASKVPSTKAWFLLLSLLATLMVANRHMQPAPGTPPMLTDRQATAPRRVVLSSPTTPPRPRAVVTLSASATL